MSMILLSVVIPCYNSQEYMKYCIESFLSCGEQVVLINVNDGSSDQRASNAGEHAMKYLRIVKVIHQQNGGHVETGNAGIRYASGQILSTILMIRSETVENLEKKKELWR